MKNKNVALILISHTDLDGYTSQYLANLLAEERVKKAGLRIGAKYPINLDYSEIQNFVNDELPQILKYAIEECKHIHIYITDLNLGVDLCQDVNDMLGGTLFELSDNGYDGKLFLYDHHITGQESAKKFRWYYLDSSRSTSKIVYDLLIDETESVDPDYHYANLTNLVSLVNAADIFKVNETINFGAGRALTRLMAEVCEIMINLVPNKKIDRTMLCYHFYNLVYDALLGRGLDGQMPLHEFLNLNSEALDLFKEKVNQKDKIGLENLIRPLTITAISLTLRVENIRNNVMKEYLSPERLEGMTLAEIRNLTMAYQVLMDSARSKGMVKVDVGDGRVVKWLIFNSKGMNISDIGREVLLADTSLDFVLGYQTIDEEVICSLRSLNKDDLDNLELDKPMFDVSTLAKSLGGGGHVNASGFQVTDEHEIKSKVNEALKGVL